MSKGFSPEDKLLNLIKQVKNKEREPARDLSSGPVPAKDQRAEISGPRPHKNISLPRISFRANFWITAGLTAAIIYLLANLLWPVFALNQAQNITIKEEPVAAQAAGQNSTEPSLEIYQDAVKTRQLFQEPAAAAEQETQNAANLDAVKDIRLMGIITGANPQAVIENTKTGQSFYVSQGQSIGPMLLTEILEGKIIVEYRGKRFELYL